MHGRSDDWPHTLPLYIPCSLLDHNLKHTCNTCPALVGASCAAGLEAAGDTGGCDLEAATNSSLTLPFLHLVDQEACTLEKRPSKRQWLEAVLMPGRVRRRAKGGYSPLVQRRPTRPRHHATGLRDGCWQTPVQCRVVMQWSAQHQSTVLGWNGQPKSWARQCGSGCNNKPCPSTSGLHIAQGCTHRSRSSVRQQRAPQRCRWQAGCPQLLVSCRKGRHSAAAR